MTVFYPHERCGKEKSMKREVGLWIDHTKAIIVTVVGETDETRKVRSNIEKHVHFSGGSQSNPLYGTFSSGSENNPNRIIANYLSPYYDGVVSLIRHADSIWIFGPGDAKGELEKRLQRDEPGVHIVGVETVDKMTDRQIAAKVRQYYQR
jgi:hypothetical protein